MKAKECYHCGEAVKDWKAHDCWTTTEEKLTEELPEDLMDAWLRLRETAVQFGEQRVYASHSCIMFSRTNCYFFVRPRPKRLELCIFLGRTVKDPRVRKVYESSKVKRAHVVHVTHRDEIEAPITDWLREAYNVTETLRTAKAKGASPRDKKKPSRKKAKRAK